LSTTYKSHTIIIPKVLHYGPQPEWIAMTWQPGFQVIWPGRHDPYFASYVAITVGNVDGVLYYYRFNIPKLLAPSLVFSPVFELAIQPIAQELHELLKAGQTVLDDSTQLIYEYRIQALATATGLTALGLAWTQRAIIISAGQYVVSQAITMCTSLICVLPI
jgi:hypothetical protein